MEYKTNPCAHCKGKKDENCPCIDKTIYEIDKIAIKKKVCKEMSVECYVRRRSNDARANFIRRYYEC